MVLSDGAIVALKISVVVFILILFIVGIMLFVQSRYRKRQNRLFCEIYKKNGDRAILITQLDKDFIEPKIEGVKKRFFIVKDAIRKEYQKKIFRYSINHFISFDEDIAMPFIIGFVGKDKMKQYLGSEKAEKMFNTKIWEEVGGIGKSNISIGMIIAIIAGIGILGLIIYSIKTKGTPKP